MAPLQVKVSQDQLAKINALSKIQSLLPLIDEIRVGDRAQWTPANYSIVRNMKWRGKLDQLSGDNLLIWELPSHLANLTAGERTFYPPFQLMHVKENSSSGKAAANPVPQYVRATVLNLTLKRLPAASDCFGKVVYEIVGVRESEMPLLERLKTMTNGTSVERPTDFKLLFPDKSGSIECSAINNNASPLVRIQKANCSTETNPSEFLEMVDEDSALIMIDEFIRLLWEASITRSGGFRFIYADETSGESLPERLFAQSDEATVKLIFLMPRSEGEPQLMKPFVNSIVTPSLINGNEAIGSILQLAIQSGAAEDFSDSSHSLCDLANIYYSDAAGIGESNSGLILRSEQQLYITSGTYMVKASGPNTPSDIAQLFNMDVQKLLEANPALRSRNQLAPSEAVKLPDLTITVSSGATLLDLSVKYGVPVAALAASNDSVRGLFADRQKIMITSGPGMRTSITPPGTVEMTIQRQISAEVDDSSFDAQVYLQNIYQMIQPRIWENADFTASDPGLPASPMADSTGSDASSTAEEEKWHYRRTIPYFSYVKPRGSSQYRYDQLGQNPYVGAGRMVQIDLEWLDVFGNSIRSQFNDFSTDPVLNRVPVIVGSSDALIGPAQWPCVSMEYGLLKSGHAKVSVHLYFKFDKSTFESDSDRTTQQVQERKKNAIAIYQKALKQLQATGDENEAAFYWRTSLNPGKTTPLSPGNKNKLMEYLWKIWNWLNERQTDVPPLTFSLVEQVPVKVIQSIPVIHELKVELLMKRPLSAVSPGFRTSSAVYEASFSILPVRARKHKPESEETQDEGLSDFAAKAEEALNALNIGIWKIAQGSNRFCYTGGDGEQPLWTVRIASNDREGAGIRFDRLQDGPYIYAPKPLTNRSEVFEYSPTWTYSKQNYFEEERSVRVPVQRDRAQMEDWARIYVESFDEMLSPRNCAAMAIIKHFHPLIDFGGQLIALKLKLAELIAQQLDYVFAGKRPEQPQLDSVRKVYHQRLLKDLSNAYYTGALLQFPSETEGYNAEPTPCKLYGPIVASSGKEKKLPNGIALSNAKVPIGINRGRNDIQFVMYGRDEQSQGIDPAQDAVKGYVELDTGYLPTHIEHQIDNEDPDHPTGSADTNRYLASSWLHFVRKPNLKEPDKWELYRPLGCCQVPLILRAYPEEPLYVSQTFVDPIGENNPASALADYLRCNYQFEYKRSKHYAQDRLYFTIRFNEAIEQKASFLEEEDLCTSLAKFNDIYYLLKNHLNEHFGNATNLQDEIASMADQDNYPLIRIFCSYVTMAQAVANRWEAPVAMRAMKEDKSYRFRLSEAGERIGTEDGVLVITWEEITQSPILFRRPWISIKGYETEFEADSRRCADGLCTYKFKFRQTHDSAYLKMKHSQSIASRILTLEGLNVAANQSVCTYAYVTRNEELIKDRLIAEPFVYRTGEKRMAPPIMPSLVRRQQIDLFELNGDKWELQRHLSLFMNKLFEECKEEEVSSLKLQLWCAYSFCETREAFRLDLPVTWQPPTSINKNSFIETEGWSVGRYNPNASLVCNLTSRIWNFFSEHQPKANRGRLEFKLMLKSTLTTSEMPLIEFDNVVVDVASLQDELPLYTC